MKISSGGYATAALTSANDVYFWGRPGYPEGLLTGSPTPLDLDGQDFLDVAVGFNHMMILTTERKLFVVGDGGSGQLGQETKHFNDWTEISLPLKETQRISRTHAGYKTSFVLVEDIT
jgi:alpha-tubulin suppressor-like RCC1 family protein